MFLVAQTERKATTSRLLWSMILLGVLVVGAGFMIHRSALRPAIEAISGIDASIGAVDWPIRVEYSLVYNNGIDQAHEMRVIWLAESLLEWTTVQVCCGEHEVGTTMRVHGDGRVFFGGNDGSPITYQSTHQPHDGLVPIPDFGPKYSTDLADLQSLDFISVLADQELQTADPIQLEKLEAVADSLSLDRGDIVGYRVKGLQNSYTERWVYKPLNLTLLSDEVVDGQVVRHLVVYELTALNSEP